MNRSLFRTLIKTTRRAAAGVFFFFHSYNSFSAIQPSNGSVLNFTQVMFEYNEVPSATRYIITIIPVDAVGTNDQSGWRQVNNSSLACIVSGLQFGKSYKWHCEAFKKKKSVFKTEDYTFSIAPYYFVDTTLFRSKIEVSKKGEFDNDIIFLDYTGTAIDRQGNPVWYCPLRLPDATTAPNLRNMRMTFDGNITYQDNSDCYEVDIKGHRLWIAPNDGRISGKGTEFYHHDFRKLYDGTYLTSSYKYETELNFYNPTVTCTVRYNTLIQYDASGRVLWYWNERDHVSKEVIFQGYTGDATVVEGTHLNGFDYDTAEDAIVMSFRNNSSIIKIDKKTGNIIYSLADYGAQSGKQIDPWFARQHGPFILPGHRLLVYNNNVMDTINGATYPKILIVKEPYNGEEASIEWQYECRSDQYPKGIIGKEGYAAPLPNDDILVCMGAANFAFEVTPAKEIVWQSRFEKFDAIKKGWTGFSNYRCNYASSLYPKYFTAQYVNNKKSIKINNEGTDSDSYVVELLLADGKTKIFTDSIAIQARSSALIKLPTKTALARNDQKNNLVLLVSSVTNRLTPRIIYFEPGNKNF